MVPSAWQLILRSVAHAHMYTVPTLEGFGHSSGRISIFDLKHLLSELVIQTPVIIKEEKRWILG